MDLYLCIKGGFYIILLFFDLLPISMMPIPIYSSFTQCNHYLCQGEFVQRLCPFRYSTFCYLTQQHDLYRCPDLTQGESHLLVVCENFASLAIYATKDVFDEGIHYGHSLISDTSFRMNLFQHFVNIR